MNFTVRLILFILCLETAMAIHEYGHLREFQKRGIAITDFSLGIGPVLYQYQTKTHPVSIRAIPIIAYVKPATEAYEKFKEQGAAGERISAYGAGAFLNLTIAVIILWLLQTVGYFRGNLAGATFVMEALLTPLKVVARFFIFLLGCLTLGRINLVPTVLLCTGNPNLPLPIRGFVRINLALGLFNLVPVIPLDGGKIAEVLIPGFTATLSQLPTLAGFALFVAFYSIANNQDWRMFDSEK